MIFLALMACDSEIGKTVSGTPIDESVVICREDSDKVSIVSHTAAAHVINIAVCDGLVCDLSPEAGALTQVGATITLDCTRFDEGVSLRVRTLRMQ